MRDERLGKLVLGERGSARMSYSAAYDMPASAHRDCDKSLGRGTLLIASLCSVRIPGGALLWASKCSYLQVRPGPGRHVRLVRLRMHGCLPTDFEGSEPLVDVVVVAKMELPLEPGDRDAASKS